MTAIRRTDRDADRIHALWDELADLPLGSDEALFHLMRTFAGWLGADNAFWVGAVRVASGKAATRDPQRGWRGRAVILLHAPPEREKHAQTAMRAQDSSPDATTIALTATAGTFRIHRLRDGFFDLAAFRRTPNYKTNYTDAGITDRLWTVTPVNADAESYLVFDIYKSRRRFSARDTELAATALRGLKWFHRSLLLSHGLPIAGAPLSPAQRKVLALLLTDRSEKEIAHDLAVTPGTAHQYVVDIFRKFGVKSRAALMALWIGAPPQDRTAAAAPY